MADIIVESGFTNEAHPELFDIRAMPPQPSKKKPGQLPESMIRQFFEKGYVIVDKFFTAMELEPSRKATEDLVEDLAQKLFKAGKIKDLHREHGLFQRLTKIEEEFPGANIILHKLGEMPKAYCDLWSNERLLNVIEQLIGPNIAGSPVWNLRTKTPQNEATTVPWHQDNGYFDNNAYKVLIPSMWIPLLDATEENGTLQVAENGHKTGRMAKHQCCWGNTWYVMMEEEEMKNTFGIDLEKEIKTCIVPYGGFILFSNMLPHRSLPNLSKDVRWSLDLRWQKPENPDGLWGLKKPVLMRTGDNPNYKIDWEPFNSVNRHSKQKQTVQGFYESGEHPEFDTTIQGPWMKKWEITHVNRHIDKFREEETKGH